MHTVRAPLYGPIAATLLAVALFSACAPGDPGDIECFGLPSADNRCTDEPPPPTVCGDGVCSGAEVASTCFADCGHDAVCGDGVCSGLETGPGCPADCPPVCGDGFCQLGETAATCMQDCAPTCGDGICEASERCVTDCSPCHTEGCTVFDCAAYCVLQAGCEYIGPGLVWESEEACIEDCEIRNTGVCMDCIATYTGVRACDADCDPTGCSMFCGTSVYCGG